MGGMAVRLLMASPAGAEVGRRFAEWTGRWPRKALARRFDASERTVQSWREGVLPQSTTLTKMVEEWGIGFLEFIFAPVLKESDLGVARRIARIQSDVEALKKDMADESAGPAAGARRGMVRGAGRAAAAAVAGILIAATTLHQIAPERHLDMARLRGGSARLVRVLRAEGEGEA